MRPRSPLRLILTRTCKFGFKFALNLRFSACCLPTSSPFGTESSSSSNQFVPSRRRRRETPVPPQEMPVMRLFEACSRGLNCLTSRSSANAAARVPPLAGRRLAMSVKGNPEGPKAPSRSRPRSSKPRSKTPARCWTLQGIQVRVIVVDRSANGCFLFSTMGHLSTRKRYHDCCRRHQNHSC